MKVPPLAAVLLALALVPSLRAEPKETLTANQMATQLAVSVQDGDSSARARFSVRAASAGDSGTLQVKILSRRDPASSEVVYEVLWPASRKGERVLLRQKRGGSIEGQIFAPPDQRRNISRSQSLDTLLGTDLAMADAVENFFLWHNQSFVGHENIGSVECVILESKPGPNDLSPYGAVRSWIDPRRLAALRVEKSDKAGRLVRRIDSSQIVKDDIGRSVPLSMTVRRLPGDSVTEIEGSALRHDAAFSPTDFDPR